MLGGCFLFLFLHLSAFILTSFADPGKGAFGTKTREKNIQINGDKRSKTVDRGLDTSNFDISNDPNSLLADYINSRAKPYRRPVKHARDLIEVHVRASLYQVVDLDQRNNLATLLAYFDVWWIDEFIAWNASAFDGITHTYVPINWLWKPEFYLYHSIQGRTPDYANDATLEVHSDGKIRMFVPIASRSLCPVNLKFFPFDNQNCSFIVSFI
uniref:Neurotransmitter-gated ion-channel ligand-binding domain-containing protein n=1 Tax=Acrobeloides nanus TaxID=290746 RepID=A0A914ECC2_9BILA